MGITVVEFAPTDTAAAELAYQITNASLIGDGIDLPLCRHRFLANARHPMPGNRAAQALALLDGEPVGQVSVSLPQQDNTRTASVVMHVHPAHRRRGVGRALHGFVLAVATAHGRDRISGQTPDLPAPAGFAAALGAEPALAEWRSRLDITAVDPTHLDRLAASARPHGTGYSIVQWAGDVPGEYVEDVAYLDGRLLEDAPTGALDVEAEQRDGAAIRAIEEALRLRGRRLYHAGARHDATGRLVAWTMIDFGATTPDYAFQQITLVDPEHRGHRLGLATKVANLRQAMAAEPAWRRMDTWNAAVNEYMLAINTALGFRPLDRWISWQLTPEG